MHMKILCCVTCLKDIPINVITCTAAFTLPFFNSNIQLIAFL